MMRFGRIGITLLFVLSLGILSTAQDDAMLEDETLLLTFVPNIQFAPMYVAQEGGFFAEQGFDISFDYLEEPNVVDLVAAGREDFGVVSGEQVILATAQDRPLVYVYEWFQQYPIGVVYSVDLAIESAQDLVDLRVGIPGRFGATYTGFTTLLEASDLTENAVQLEEIGFSAPEVFCIGAVEASVIYINNEPLQIQNRADAGDCGDVQEVAVLPINEVVDLVSNGIITNEAMLQENPERVERFLAAFDAALALSIENPARAYLLSIPQIEGLPQEDEFVAALEALALEQEIFLEEAGDDLTADALYARYDEMLASLVEQFDADTLIQFEVLLATARLWNAEQLGFTDLASWENMQQTLLALGSLERAVDLMAIYSNDYLPTSD